nr:MAG: DNA pilot protein [Microvirus sp.]
MGWEQIAAAASGPIGAGITAIGQESANSANAKLAAETREFNSREASISRDWQQGMSNTAYQRSMRDLQDAGLNPMLAYMQGGASSGGGATASGSAATMDPIDLGKGLQNTVQSALGITQMKESIKNTSADTKVKKATKRLTEENTKTAQTNAKSAALDLQTQEADLPAQLSKAQGSKDQADWDNWARNYDNFLNRAIQTSAGIGSAIDAFRKGLQGRPNGTPRPPTDSSGRTREQVEIDNLRKRANAKPRK